MPYQQLIRKSITWNNHRDKKKKQTSTNSKRIAITRLINWHKLIIKTVSFHKNSTIKLNFNNE